MIASALIVIEYAACITRIQKGFSVQDFIILFTSILFYERQTTPRKIK